MKFKLTGSLVLLAAMSGLFITGCGKAKTETPETQVAANEGGHDHDGDEGAEHGEWWCDEHGVPEEECTQCDSSLAAAFKKKGDWCEKHDRPNSHCFVCKPELADKFAARYEAKYGKKPPAIEPEEKE